MSKLKLALLVFALAFGVNIIAFVSSKKTFTVDEVKNVWLYELPPSASPLDSYPALDVGPQQGITGTLFKAHYLKELAAPGAVPTKTVAPAQIPGAPELLIANHYEWDAAATAFNFTLVPGLTFSDHSPIKAQDFVNAHEWMLKQVPAELNSTVWNLWRKSKFEAMSDSQLKITLGAKDLSPSLLAQFLNEVLTNPWSGPIHAKNLQNLQVLPRGLNAKGKTPNEFTEKWISSGPYKIQKWAPKEIIIISRDDFPVKVPEPFFRTLRYQSAPVKNPSCEFMQGKLHEALPSAEHQELATNETVHVFWICRSWKMENRFCSTEKARENLTQILTGNSAGVGLNGQTVKYRIPEGSDAFRAEFVKNLTEKVLASGGKTEEVSYFFKPSSDADLELEFVVTPDSAGGKAWAETLALLSSRLGDGAIAQKHLIGEIDSFPMSVLMKNLKGETYPKVFLEPDLAEKKLGI